MYVIKLDTGSWRQSMSGTDVINKTCPLILGKYFLSHRLTQYYKKCTWTSQNGLVDRDLRAPTVSDRNFFFSLFLLCFIFCFFLCPLCLFSFYSILLSRCVALVLSLSFYHIQFLIHITTFTQTYIVQLQITYTSQ